MSERCKEILERTYLFLDGEGLSLEERIEIETHLEECRPCLEAYGVEREVVTVLIARLSGNIQCPERLKQRIALLLEEA